MSTARGSWQGTEAESCFRSPNIVRPVAEGFWSIGDSSVTSVLWEASLVEHRLALSSLLMTFMGAHSSFSSRQQAFGCRDANGVPAQRWSVQMSHSLGAAACPVLRAVCMHELPAGAAALPPAGSTATAFSYVMARSLYYIG